ncbi:MAG: hypothetical protein AAF614_23065 [Chloroflexota bacterium]
MSLSDHLRYLRALEGGTQPETIYEQIEATEGLLTAETCYRPVRQEMVRQLADYYGRSLDEFNWHNARARKLLTFYVAAAQQSEQPVELRLRSGTKLTGMVEWWDLSSIGLQEENGRLLVVQRSAVVDWPQAGENKQG